MKITGILKNEHGFTDYTYIPAVLAAPDMAGFAGNKMAANMCRAFSVTVLGYSLLTDAKWGAVSIIPYKVHAALDFSSGLLALGALAIPVIRNDKRARHTFIAMGTIGLVVGALSLVGSRNERLSKG